MIQFTGLPTPDHDAKIALLTDAFHRATEIASYALDNRAVKPTRRDLIFKRYFNPADRPYVDKIFRTIVGDSPDIGAAKFTDVVVSLDDPDQTCEQYVNAYVPYGTNRIQFCPQFWRLSKPYLQMNDYSQPARPACSELGIYVSEQMVFPASILLHEFL